MKALYVTDRRAVGDVRFEAIVGALRGAPSLSVQLREKDRSDVETLEWCRRTRRWLGRDVSLFVNRRFDIALAGGADGVHLPSDGLPLSRVRASTPRGFRIGVSTHSPAEACDALAGGADVVVLGPIFSTPSKEAFGPPLFPGALADLPALDQHSSDVYAIGGIDETNLSALDSYRDRVSGIAAIRLFQLSEDPRAVAERIARA